MLVAKIILILHCFCAMQVYCLNWDLDLGLHISNYCKKPEAYSEDDYVMQWQNTKAGEIMDELRERQRDLHRKSEENQTDDYLRTGLVIGGWFLIQMVANYMKIRQFMGVLGESVSGMMNSSKRQNEVDIPWTMQGTRANNHIPLM